MSSATTTEPLLLSDPDLDPSPPPPRRRLPQSFAALEVRNYRIFLSGQIVATTGLWMQRIAQDWLVLELTGKATAVGVAVALQFAPVLFFGLLGGVVADRFPKRRILLVTQSVAATLALTLGLLSLTHTIQAWHVFVIACLLGFVTVVDNPTRQVFVSELVGPKHIRNAVSLNSSVFQFGALLGPALSGLLISAVGQGWSFLINAGACCCVLVMLTALRPPPFVRPAGASAPKLSAGLRYIGRTPEVGWTIVLVAGLGLFGLNMPVILTAFADHEFRTGVGGYSLFNSLSAVGALAGALISARRREKLRLRALVGSLGALAVAIVVASLAPSVWVFGALLVLIGLSTLLFLTGANSLVQMTALPALRGRVMSVYLLVLLGGQALGGPSVGWLIDQVGARPAMTLCGAVLGLVTLVAGLAMAHQARLTLRLDLHRGHDLVRIVSH
jgi:MFS family permease